MSGEPTGEMIHQYHEILKEEVSAERRWHWIREEEEEREIMAAIEATQATREERTALALWKASQQDVATWKRGANANRWFLGMRVIDAWAPPLRKGGLPRRIVGQFTCSDEPFIQWYNSILDEMNSYFTRDGDMWSEEVEQLHLTLNRPFGASITANGREYRNMTTPMSCKLVKTGPNYWTAQADKGLGKVYIPRDIIPRWLHEDARSNNHLSLSVEVAFMGFPACRGRVFPWRAVSVELQY
tara:strand:+ start:43 stop:768 length:726 start_codon:yes stop_codon:yes gene_type:complete